MIHIEYTNELTKHMRFTDKGSISVLASVIVDSQVENRIDIISKLAYNDMSKAYVILMYNNISDAMNIPEGTEIHIPDLDSFDKYTEKVEYKTFDIPTKIGAEGSTAYSPNQKNISKRNYTKKGDNGLFIF